MIGFEPDVGSRTEYRSGHDSVFGQDSESTVTIIMSSVTASTLEPLETCARKAGCLIVILDQPRTAHRAELITMLNSALQDDALTSGRPKQQLGVVSTLSTGLLTILTAMSLCTHVDVYGFGLGISTEVYSAQTHLHSDCNRTEVYARYYHSSGERGPRCDRPEHHDRHNFGAEYEVLAALHKRGSITWNAPTVSA